MNYHSNILLKILEDTLDNSFVVSDFERADIIENKAERR